MPIHEQIERLQRQIDYVNTVLNQGGLTAWEAKEYAALDVKYRKEIEALNESLQYLKTNFPGA